MTITEMPGEARDVVVKRLRREVDDLDYRRALRGLSERGYTQQQIARWLRISQPSVHSALKTAAALSMPLDGFSGATPMEICERYAAGLMERDQLIDELVRFPYAEGGHTDGYDSLIVDPPGAWSEVSGAIRAGLIDEGVYAEVFNRRHERD